MVIPRRKLSKVTVGQKKFVGASRQKANLNLKETADQKKYRTHKRWVSCSLPGYLIWVMPEADTR